MAAPFALRWVAPLVVVALAGLAGCKGKGPPGAIVTRLAELDEVTVDDNGVYWRAGTALMHAERDGKGGRSLGQGEITRIVVDRTGIYFSSEQAGTVSSLSLAGGAPTVLANTLGKPSALATDVVSVYVANKDRSGTILKVPKGGGAAVVLADNQSEPQAVAVDATRVYWGTSSGQLMSVKKTGGPAQKIDNDTGTFADVVVDEHDVYWANVFGEGITILRKKKDGRGDKKEMTALVGLKPRLAVSGNAVFVSVTDKGQARVLKVPIGGGGAVEVVSRQGEARGLAVDRTHVFLGVKDADGAILKLPIPRP